MQLYARHVISQASWANAICLHMLIIIFENTESRVFRISYSETLNAPLSLHKLAVRHWNISANALVTTQLFFFPFQYMKPLCWIRWKEQVTVHGEVPPYCSANEWTAGVWGKQDIKATRMDGSILATFQSTCSLCLKTLHWHTKHTHIFQSQSNPFITQYLSNNML